MFARMTVLVLLIALNAPVKLLAQSEPNFDDLPDRTRHAVEAPVHRQWGRTATNVVGTGVGAAGTQVGLNALAMAAAATLPKVLGRLLPFGGGVLLGALTQKFLQGKVEWGPLLAAAGGAALAVAILNPATLPLAIGASVLGSVVGEAAWHGLKALWRDRNKK